MQEILKEKNIPLLLENLPFLFESWSILNFTVMPYKSLLNSLKKIAVFIFDKIFYFFKKKFFHKPKIQDAFASEEQFNSEKIKLTSKMWKNVNVHSFKEFFDIFPKQEISASELKKKFY